MSQLPAWDNTTEYKAIHSPDFDQDLEKAQSLLREIETLNARFTEDNDKQNVKTLQTLSVLRQQSFILLYNLMSFVGCERALDSKNEEALKAKAQLDEVIAKSQMLAAPAINILKKCSDEILAAYLDSAETKAETFLWKQERKMTPFALSDEDEKTLLQFQRFARDGWGDLYSSISGSLRVAMGNGDVIGVAQASGYLRGPDAKLREDAWRGIQRSWAEVATPCAAVLNNLAGYRLEEYAKRSTKKKMHFLVRPLFEARIEAETLEAMMGAVQDRISIPRRALTGMAKALGKKQMDPWDLNAPSPRQPSDAKVPFSEAIAMIAEAFGSVEPKMGEFVEMMLDKNWIDARILPNKTPGAFCTGFLKSNTPRVFQSYMGSMGDVSTLAHELGHAYHNWVLRDLPVVESDYPMTLAETASIFSETLLSERLMAKADAGGKFGVAWADASSAVSLLMNIPARFEFEKSFYEARQKGPLSVEELNQLMEKSMLKWFGDSVSQFEVQYWMTKLHFSISQISFYNYPYTFGYLFGLGIYAQREKLGDKFHQAYVDILRDTGRMSAEDLIQKHLGMDIRQKEFWLNSLNIVEKKIAVFEALL